MDDHSSWNATHLQTDDDDEFHTVLRNTTCGDKPAMWHEDMQRHMTSKALVLPAHGGHAPFKARFLLHHAPSYCGRFLIAVRMEFTRLVDYVFGPNLTDKTSVYVAKLRNLLEEFGSVLS